jgi:hypothetical protein
LDDDAQLAAQHFVGANRNCEVAVCIGNGIRLERADCHLNEAAG